MVYNLTNVTDAANPAELFGAINDLTGGVLFMFFLFTMFLILMAMSRGRADNVDALIASGVIVSIIGGLLWAGGYIGWRPLIVPAVLFLGMLLYKTFWRDK